MVARLKSDRIEPMTLHFTRGDTARIHDRRARGGDVVSLVRDITESQRHAAELEDARERAEAASRAKSAFLANMSHEIRTPLNGILGMAQVLEMGGLSDEQHEQVATSLDSGRNLMSLLNDILDLSKIEAGKLAMVKVDTDIAHTLRRLHRLWKPKADESGLGFSLSLDSELPQVMHFDAVRVRQCVSNLISNAIKFTPNGKVVVGARLPDVRGVVQCWVRDTGAGIDADRLDKIFDKLETDQQPDKRGVGLGLAIVKQIVELHGGTVDVESRVGEGSTFTFELPQPGH
jgi:signal transduction histidine kinase